MANALASRNWAVKDNERMLSESPVPWMLLPDQPGALGFRFDARTATACAPDWVEIRVEGEPEHEVAVVTRDINEGWGSDVSRVSDVFYEWTPPSSGDYSARIEWGQFKQAFVVRVSEFEKNAPEFVIPEVACERPQPFSDDTWLCGHALLRGTERIHTWDPQGLLEVVDRSTVAEWRGEHLSLWSYDAGAIEVERDISVGTAPFNRWDGGGRWDQDDMYLMSDGGLLLDGDGVFIIVSGLREPVPSVDSRSFAGTVVATGRGVISTQRADVGVWDACVVDTGVCRKLNGAPVAGGDDGVWFAGGDNFLFRASIADGGLGIDGLLKEGGGPRMPPLAMAADGVGSVSDAGLFSRPRVPSGETGRGGCLVYEPSTVGIVARVYGPLTGWTDYAATGTNAGGGRLNGVSWCNNVEYKYGDYGHLIGVEFSSAIYSTP